MEQPGRSRASVTPSVAVATAPVPDDTAHSRETAAGPAGYAALALLAATTFSTSATLSNALILLLGLIGVFSLCSRLWIHHIAIYAVPFLFYLLLSGFAVGSMPDSFGALFQWLNGDGRMFVALVPLLLLGTARRVTWGDLRLFVKALRFVVWLNVGVLALALAGTPVIHKLALHRRNFYGLTSSHHAAGYLFSGALLILIAARRSKITTDRAAIATIIAAAGLIVATGSRTSIVGLLAVALWTLLSRRRFSDALKVAGVTIVLAVIAVVLSAKLSGTIGEFFSQDFRTQASDIFSAGLHTDQSAHYDAIYGQQAGYVANILARFWYWGIAIGLWFKSPFLGIGSFRYNDIGIHFSGWPHIADFATSGIDNSADLKGAHNQFLGILVENGILGLALLLLIWLVPYRMVKKRAEIPVALRESGRQMVPFAFGTALTGYTMAAPSLTFICLTWLVIVGLVDTERSPVRGKRVEAHPARTAQVHPTRTVEAQRGRPARTVPAKQRAAPAR